MGRTIPEAEHEKRERRRDTMAEVINEHPEGIGVTGIRIEMAKRGTAIGENPTRNDILHLIADRRIEFRQRKSKTGREFPWVVGPKEESDANIIEKRNEDSEQNTSRS